MKAIVHTHFCGVRIIPKDELGEVIGRILAAFRSWSESEAEEDLISRHYGFTPGPSPFPKVDLGGWTIKEIREELERRGIDYRFCYMSGLDEALDQIEHKEERR